MSSTAETEATQAGILVERVAIRNFRGIKDLAVNLQPGLSLLVGRNNAGKSRILRALHVAVGGVQVDRDDLTVGSTDPSEIDVVLAPRRMQSGIAAAPTSASGASPEALEETFDPALQQIFGSVALVSESPVRQRFAWRTTVTSIREGFGARSESHAMTYVVPTRTWSPTGQLLTREVRNLVYAELVDTRRDLDEELRRRGTAIRRILNDLQVREGDRADLEQRLAALGDDVVLHSDTLKSLRDSLDSLDRFVDSLGAARVDPVPRTLEELARAVGVSFDDGVDRLASRLHGSGIRSLASLLVQDVFYGQTLGRDGGTIRPHPVTLIEEPEAHLHPHAISEIAGLLVKEGRQVIATTHSPQLAASVVPEALLLVRQTSEREHSIVDFGPVEHDEDDDRRTKKPRFYVSEMEKLTRLAERPFGELLFARAIVIGDGATERAFLPSVLRAALGPLAHGISVVDSAGMDGQIVPAVIKFARHVEVPLVVFADADQAGKGRVESLVACGLLDGHREVVWATCPDAERSSRSRQNSVAVERMMIDAAMDACIAACGSLGETPRDGAEALVVMKRHKGTIGAVLAQEFLAAHPFGEANRWPEPLRKLVSVLRGQLGATPGASGGSI